ncbi:hypothetical protein [Thalassoroseus pseudoceratinae]|uniref:hypothetical protein n=1 Tax=Thalassoroseus pseudoceratinae TaxID=2713176 RepID=UPI001422BD7E|nr:hypothetical protein [Thalassoroseus pseudoceratinae]
MMEWRACGVTLLGLCLWGCGKSQDGEFHDYPGEEARKTVTESTDDGQSLGSTDGANQTGEPTAVEPNADTSPTPQPIDPKTLPPTAPAVAEKQKGDDKPLSAGDPSDSPTETAAKPREIKVLIPNKEFQEVGPENAIRVSYDDIDLLKVLNMDPVPADCVKYFPEWLKNLDGQRIRLRGFMYPPFQETDLPFFVLARDNAICCFGRDPKRYDVIDVTMRDGETTDYIANRPFDVVGVFHIAPETSQGQLYQLYLIDDAVVIEP